MIVLNSSQNRKMYLKKKKKHPVAFLLCLKTLVFFLQVGSVFITSENVSRPSYSIWLQSIIPTQTATYMSPCKQIGRKASFLKKIFTKEKWLRRCSNPGRFVCSSCGELYSLFTTLKSVSHFTNCFPRCWLCLTMSPSFFTVLFLFLPGF